MSIRSGQAIEPIYGDLYSGVRYLPDYEFRLDWQSHNEVRMILTGVDGKEFCVPLTEYYVSKEHLITAFNSRYYTLFVFRVINSTEDKCFILESGNEEHSTQLKNLLANRDILMWRTVTLEPCTK